jgi:hypothetical protein
MKQRIIFICLIAFVTLSFITPPSQLVGRWQQTINGVKALFVFRSDDTFEVFINGKAFTNGKYFVRHDTLSMADVSCNTAYYGTYKLSFYAPDSLRFTTIADTCQGRKGDMHNLTVGRVIKAKP